MSLKKRIQEESSQFREAFGAPFDSFQEYVAEHGEEFTVRDEGLSHLLEGPPKYCFANCLAIAVENPELQFVEGFADPCIEGLPILLHHAWLVGGDSKVVDPTWTDERHKNCTYIGLRITPEELLAWVQRPEGSSTPMEMRVRKHYEDSRRSRSGQDDSVRDQALLAE